MEYIYLCNTAADSISKVNADKLLEENRIMLNKNEGRLGPHSFCFYKSKMYIANSYGNKISIVDIRKSREIDSIYIGCHCNDIAIYNDKAYLACGDLNSILVLDIASRKILETIPAGNLPHNIDIYKDKMVVSNMGDDTVSLINLKDGKNIKNIRVGPYPTKAKFTSDGSTILVCESNIGSYKNGGLAFVDVKKKKILFRINLGSAPIDLFCSKSNCYVSNLGDGTVSIIKLDCFKESKRIDICSMPRGIMKKGKYLYVGDNYRNELIRYDLLSEKIKKVQTGREPTSMILLAN
ncbi:MAG: YncE family protein [Clostridiaceae bacterium]